MQFESGSTYACAQLKFFSNSYSWNFKDFIKPKKSLKVPFKKGRGLTNWMSIVRKGQNISGIEPRRPVTETELREHNTRFNKNLKYFCLTKIDLWAAGCVHLDAAWHKRKFLNGPFSLSSQKAYKKSVLKYEGPDMGVKHAQS